MSSENDDEINPVIKEKLSFIYISTLVEIHRMIVSSFLITPKICGKTICNLNETIMTYQKTDLAFYILGFNFITFFVFISLYLIEIKRENVLADYLCNDKSRFNNNSNVELLLEILPSKIREKILRTNMCYKRIVALSILFFVLNTIANIYMLYYSCNIPTLMVLMTNTFFMGSKLFNSYSIIRTEKYIFYSAFYNEKYQFNDINPYLLKDIKSEFNHEQTQ